MYRTTLAMAGYVVVAVEDGYSALQWIETDRPDGIILDLGLPRLGGRDLQREIAAHAETRAIPIVVVTGTSADDLDPADFRCVLRKPIKPDRLVDAARQCFPRPRGFSTFR
jgi:CheY-like chemotaxis protein